MAVDPLEVLLVLADRGGSPALFGVGLLITIGATLLSLGSLGLALRDIRLDPRSRGELVRRQSGDEQTEESARQAG